MGKCMKTLLLESWMFTCPIHVTRLFWEYKVAGLQEGGEGGGDSGSVAGTSDHEGYVAQICGYRWSYDLRSLGVTLEQPHNRGIALEELISEWPGLIKNEWQTFAPSMNSSRESFPSIFLSICLKILSVLFSGVDSSSGIFITDPTWRHKYSKGCNFCFKRFQNVPNRSKLFSPDAPGSKCTMKQV